MESLAAISIIIVIGYHVGKGLAYAKQTWKLYPVLSKIFLIMSLILFIFNIYFCSHIKLY